MDILMQIAMVFAAWSVIALVAAVLFGTMIASDDADFAEPDLALVPQAPPALAPQTRVA